MSVAATPETATGVVRVTFTPSGRRGHFARGTTVLDAARTLGVDLDSVCGGRGICGRCQISVGSAPGVDADDARLSEPGAIERDYKGRRALEGRRLGCAARVVDDVVVDVPAASQVHRQVVRKEAGVRDLPVDPVVRLHYVEVEQPALESPSGDLQRLLEALEREWALDVGHVDGNVLTSLQRHLRDPVSPWAVTAAVREQRELIGVWPGFRDTIYGAAFDIGSTTIAGHICDLSSGAVLASAGTMNPQIGFGEDLMSRVSYVQLNPGGHVRLTELVRDAVDGLLGELVESAGLRREDVVELTAVGNPIMHHLFLGIDPSPLGTAPFALATTDAVTSAAADVGIAAHPGARLYLLPCVAGHVGADATGAALAEGPHRGEELQLLIDVGTNAEIILGNREHLLAASSPTGPAFEGAQISAGQRAAPGAIERVRIDPGTLEPRFKVIGSDLWSDDADFAAAVSATGVTGICGSGIIEAIAEMFLAGIVSSDGVIGESDHPRIVRTGRTNSYRLSEDPVIDVTQNDVRAIQLAKAALQAGCRLLMDHAGVESVDEIRLAGAFGAHIDPLRAMVIGMIPDCEVERVRSAGNAAGVGALMALTSRSARREVEAMAGSIDKVETATEPRFQEHFVAAIAFPNSQVPYPKLASVVDLPAPAGARPRARGRRARKEEP